MKNKVKFKKTIIYYLILSLIIISISLIINIKEYNTYTKNYNYKLSQILSYIISTDTNINENDLIEILNKENNEDYILNKYGIDIPKDSAILKNDKTHEKYLIINSLFISLSLLTIIIIFIKYNLNKDKELNNITRYIEEINNKNYSLKIDELSEDELSILKNEVYKVTILLKEQAENSKKDKLNLKKSLEDISHQLKTPLTSILIMLDSLIDNPNMKESQKQEYIISIKREIININFLVHSLLKLSKFDSNTIEFINKDTLISNLLEETIKNVSSLCDLRNISIKKPKYDKTSIYCDIKWQTEALTNILKNCIDHSKDNSIIEINYKDNKVYTEITIKDYGTGINKKDIPHIFERFYKGQDSKSDNIGIGLSLSKSIIEENNGTIKVESVINEYTKFTIKYFKNT